MKGIKGDNPTFPFYIKDWLTDPQLKMACFITKGIWIDLLCIMWKSKERGIISGTEDQLRRLLGATEHEFRTFLDDAKGLDFCDIICKCHKMSQESHTIVTIKNRRMWREEKLRSDARLRKQMEREKKRKKKVSQQSHKNVPRVFPSPFPFPKGKEKKSTSLFLSELLLELIKTRNPKFKIPDLDKWGVSIDRMIRIDKRDPTEIEKVIKWVQQDEFWQNNILSTHKLRKQYDQLFMKMSKDNNPYGL